MNIILDTDQSYAPGCYMVCQVNGEGDWNPCDESTTILVQGDTDHCGIASTFGWTHPDILEGSTDGTVDGPTATAGEMLESAQEYLDSIVGDIEHIVDDPGYFE